MMHSKILALVAMAMSLPVFTMADYTLPVVGGGIHLRRTNEVIPPNSGLGTLNSHFNLRVEAAATSIAYPLSFAPLYFTSICAGISRGITIGHTSSINYVEVRMCDTNTRAVVQYDNPRPLVSAGGRVNVFELSCVKVSAGRICSLKVNGETATARDQQNDAPTNDMSALYRVTGDIHSLTSPGVFGNVWGWRFEGYLDAIVVSSPQSGCVTYGSPSGSSPVNPTSVTFSGNSMLDMMCPSTATSTTTTTTTTTTVTTGTGLQQLERRHDNVTSFLAEQLETANSNVVALNARLSQSEAMVSTLVSQMTALQGTLGNLDATEAPLSVPDAGCVEDNSGLPTMQASDDGNLDVLACGGSINFKTSECVVNICQLQQDVALVQNKLEALSDTL